MNIILFGTQICARKITLALNSFPAPSWFLAAWMPLRRVVVVNLKVFSSSVGGLPPKETESSNDDYMRKY